MKYINDKIRQLRERAEYSQHDLAKKLGISRSAVNAWELGISIPSTRYIIEMARLFRVSTDYLLGVERENYISLGKLSEKQIRTIYRVLDCFNDRSGMLPLSDCCQTKK